MTKLNDIKKDLKDLALMKQHAANVSKALRDVERIGQEVKGLETDLEATGSSRTAEDVRTILNEVSANLSVVSFRFRAAVSYVLIIPDVVDLTRVNVRRSKRRKRVPTIL